MGTPTNAFTRPVSPRPPPRPRRYGFARAAFTLTETLIVIGIVVIIAALLLPLLSRVRAASRSAVCLSNLRQIGTAFRMYAQNNDDKLPYPAFTQIPWERSVAVYTSERVFVCPSDQELAPTTGSSYDWRDTGVRETTLAGRTLHEPNRPVVLIFDALPSWHERARMNVAFTDGSVRSLSEEECLADLIAPVRDK